MAVNLQALSMDQLSALANDVRLEQQSRVQQIRGAYGELFCGIIGVDTLGRIRTVKARKLNLHNDPAHLQQAVAPFKLRSSSVVRGVMGSGRAFIAIKINIIDQRSARCIDTVVELVFQRFAFETGNYMSAFSTKGITGTVHPSYLSNTEMSKKQLEAVKALLNGEQIVAPMDKSILIELA